MADDEKKDDEAGCAMVAAAAIVVCLPVFVLYFLFCLMLIQRIWKSMDWNL